MGGSALTFLEAALPRAAKTLASPSLGAVFQALLAELPSDHGPRSARHSSLKLVDAFKADALAVLVLDARGLCDLIRLKIEDDEDLAVAQEALKDCRSFLNELASLAKRRESHS